MITISAFRQVPPFAQGLVRDLRVRWALEEAGLDHQVRVLEAGEKDGPDYRCIQPFGQVPIFEEDGLKLFESGAIVLYIGEKSEALLPRDRIGKARATAWVFCALNTMEMQIQQLAALDLFYANEDWAKTRRPAQEEMVKKRLSELAAALGDKEYLEDRFTVGDLMVAAVLRILRHTDLVAGEPRLQAYLDRCTARPAFQRALDAQMAVFKAAA